MSTPNFKTQKEFQLYASNNFLIYPYAIDDNDDYILDENGDYIIDYDGEPYFDYNYLDECKDYMDTYLNSKLAFFEITLIDGYYDGIQTFITPKYPNDFDPLDYLYYPQYYNNSDLFAEFGYNTYILKKKINKEINLINKELLPALRSKYHFDKLNCVAMFSNGEAIYEKC